MKNSTYFWMGIYILIACIFPVVFIITLFISLFAYIVYSGIAFILSFDSYYDKEQETDFKFSLHNLIKKFNNWLNNLKL